MTGSDAALDSWLRELDEQQLAELLALRQDAVTPTPPSLTALGERLRSPASLACALATVDQACVEVFDLLSVLGDNRRASKLARLVDLPAAELDRVLGELRRRALVWPHNDRLRVAVTARNAGVGLGVGDSAARLLGGLTISQLMPLAERLGCRRTRQKAKVIAAMLDVLGDHDAVRAMVADAPAEVHELLDTLVWRDPRLVPGRRVSWTPVGELWGPPEQQWLMQRCLLLPVQDRSVELPREVAMALRGKDYRIAISPAPAPAATGAIDEATVHGQAGTAALTTVDGVTRLLELCSREPLSQLRTGVGVGPMELRRAARSLGSDVGAVRLWIELGAAAGLLVFDRERLLPTTRSDTWRAGQPAERLVPLLFAWHRLPCVPTVLPAGKAPPALAHRTGVDDSGARHDVLRAYAELPDGHGYLDPTALVDGLAWRRPLYYRAGAASLHASHAEAQALGMLAAGALSGLGRALLAGDRPSVVAAATRLLPAATGRVRLQADLTAVVAGVPDAELSALLDLVADAAERDTASVWRFSPSSVRRALDSGYTSERVLAELAEFADGPVPQPLDYLVRDTGRRHGQVSATEVSCCVCAEDPALLAEIAANRQLASLGLRLLAPTVLASAEPVTTTLRALRAAGYAPSRTAQDGTAVVERRISLRAEPEPAEGATVLTMPPRPAPQPEPEATAALARKLIATARTTHRRERAARRTVAERLREFCTLSNGEVTELAEAIQASTPVEIGYQALSGVRTTRVITPTEYTGATLIAWCHLRDDERKFLVQSIRSVRALAR